MNKILLYGYDSFVSFVDDHTGNIPGQGNVISDFWTSPEKYPCVLVWGIRYVGMAQMLFGEFVYLDDFETE